MAAHGTQLNSAAWSSLLLLAVFVAGASAKFLWFEKAPDPSDKCTIIRSGLKAEGWEDIHPAPDCSTGGLIWYYTTGRIRAHFFLDATYERDFEICLTAGEANSLYVWVDHKGKYWTPMAFPNYMVGDEFKERCKRSYKGKLDLFFEPPWYKIHYVSHVSWTVTELPPGTVSENDEGEEDVSDIPI